MKRHIEHLIAGEGGASKIVPLELDLVDLSVGTGGLQMHDLGEQHVSLLCFAAGYNRSTHNSEAPGWAFILSGEIEIVLSDGSVQTVGAGNIALFDDVTGGGHGLRVKPGGDDAWVLSAGLERD